MALTADEVLEKIGSFGRFQLFSLVLSSVNQCFWCAWPVLLTTFITAEPAWRCISSNNTVCPFGGTMKPGDMNYNFRCNISRTSWEFVEDFTSIVTQFDLVCNNAIYGPISSSLIFAGWSLGAVMIGSLGDKFGRKKAVYISGFFVTLFNFLSAFSNDYWLFTFFKFAMGFFIGGMSGSNYVLMYELAGVKDRGIMGACYQIYCGLSLATLAGLAYLVRDWRNLCVLTGSPAIMALFGFFLYPESLRWLLVKGKMEEAEKLYRKIARVNGKELPEERLEIEIKTDSETRLDDIRDLFRTTYLRMATLVTCISWIAVNMMYYGISLSASNIGGNTYLNFFIESLVQLPAIPAGTWIYDRFGRKRGVVVPLTLSATGIAGAALLNTYDGSNKVIFGGKIFLSMIWAKFCISISFNGIYLYSSELFPTVVRNIGLCTSSSCGRIGSILCTYILFLEHVNPLLPYGIMGIVALASALLCTLLPETRFKPTLENIDKTIQHGSFTNEIKKDDMKRISANDEESPLVSRI